MASTIWRGHLTFGLISIPVRLFRAGRAERIPLKRVARVRSDATERADAEPSDTENRAFPLTLAAKAGRVVAMGAESANSDAPAYQAPLVAVRQRSVLESSGDAMPESAITRGVEVEKNRFVEIPAEKLKSLKVETSPDLAIQEFVALAEIDPLYFETSYYVVPEEAGEKAYALLYVSLVKSNVVAIGEVSMHGRDHVVVVRPGQTGLVAHTMFYSSEVHLDEQFRADVSAVGKRERELAETLIGSLTTNFEPEKYKNAYQSKLQALIDERVGGATEQTPPERTRAAAEVVDIADALRRSLAQLKKPAQRSIQEEAPARPIHRVKKATRTSA